MVGPEEKPAEALTRLVFERIAHHLKKLPPGWKTKEGLAAVANAIAEQSVMLWAVVMTHKGIRPEDMAASYEALYDRKNDGPLGNPLRLVRPEEDSSP